MESVSILKLRPSVVARSAGWACSRAIWRQVGLSLLEVMLSLGILATVALGLLGLFISSRAASQGGTARAEMSNVAEAQLQRLRTLPYSQLESFLASAPADSTLDVGGNPVVMRVRVERMDSDATKPEYSLLWLNLRLTWQQHDRLNMGSNGAGLSTVARSFEMSTLVAPGTSQ